jgi:tetratricopeptide (TPR) repeat protein/transcriptional regulator with XRE-family HTH domain
MTTGGGDHAPAHGPATPALLLRAFRARAMLSQEELAGRSGVSVRTIRDLETGHILLPRHGTVRLLADALGLDDRERAALAAATRGRQPAEPAPRYLTAAQLPAEPIGFTGRGESMAVLDTLLGGRAVPAPVTVVISAIAGSAGVGKTALALHWGHRVAGRFGDGQLYVDLRGYAPGPPLSPIQALTQLLRALGVDGDKIPVEPDEAAALYRSLLADRRALVVLDNARDADQVRPLLPGGRRCVVLVTSRDRLTGLVASHGARRLTLDVLAPGEAVDLLARILGGERVASEPEAAVVLARLCGHLPLALRIAAANLAGDPHQSVEGYVTRLRQGDRLDSLAVDGDPQVAVRAAFDLSYGRLAPDARRLFRLLGLVPGPEIGVAAAAALAGVPHDRAERLLTGLAAAHLIQPRGPGRYGFHDLLRLYARERAARADGEPERRAAVRRLLAWLLAGVEAAGRFLYPQILRLPGDAGEPGHQEAVEIGDHAAALAWLDAERANLIAAVASASEHGSPAMAWLLADALRGYFWQCRCLVDWLAVAEAGLSAATAGGDPRAQAACRLSLGDAHQSMGRFPEAVEHYAAALDAARRTGWAAGQAAILGSLGNAYGDTAELRQAVVHTSQALALYRQIGSASGEANALNYLGNTYLSMGALREASASHSRALALYHQIGSRPGEANALTNLGISDHALGRMDQAAEHLAAALALHRELGDRYGEACDLDALAAVHRDARRHGQALAMAEDALAMARGVGDVPTEAKAHNTVGSILLGAARHEPAAEHHRRALALSRGSGLHFHETDAMLGLAAVDHRTGRHRGAVQHARRALTLARRVAYRMLEGQALSILAAARLALGDHHEAAEHACQALSIQREIGHRVGEASTLAVLGQARRHAGASDIPSP